MCAFVCFIPATIFLTISYFVLLTLQKAESARIKFFGKVVTVILWCIAAMVIILGFYVAITGICPLDKLLTP